VNIFFRTVPGKGAARTATAAAHLARLTEKTKNPASDKQPRCTEEKENDEVLHGFFLFRVT